MRPIDDFTEFGHNGTSWTHERVDLATVDVCAGMVKELHCMVGDRGALQTTLADGTVVRGWVRTEFARPGQRTITGRTLDLRRAFKQLAPSPSMASLTIVAVWDSRAGGVRYYELRALPFGARNAVFGFGSVARSLEIILVNLFDVFTGQYVDNFPQFEFAQLAAERSDTMVEVLKLLGWDVKKVNENIPEFCSSFGLLGVIVDLHEASAGRITLRNRPDRAAKIEADVAAIIARGWITAQEAEALRGSLNFARAQTFGRCGASALHFLASASRAGGCKLSAENLEYLYFWAGFFRDARPRIVVFRDTRPCVLAYTDGSEEGESVGVGGVLVLDQVKEAFAGKVKAWLVEEWRRRGGKSKVIHQAELFPAVLAMKI